MPYKDQEAQRAANRRYYERNKGVYRAKNDKKRERLKVMMREAKSVPCMDCGESYPYFVMDFDHRDPNDKEWEIAKLVHRGSLTKLQEEMAKCDVVCANCHRIRTYA